MVNRRIALAAFALTVATVCLAAPVNPPPASKLSGYSGYELKPVTLAPEFAEKQHVDKVVARVEEYFKSQVGPILADWNASANASNPQKLVIEPRIETLHKPSRATRFFAGAWAGNGHIVIKMKITEQPSGRLLAEPEFYRRSSAVAGGLTIGAHDNAMLQKIAGLAANYLTGNYNEAVGGATGYEP